MKSPLINDLAHLDELICFGKTVVDKCRENQMQIRLIGSVGIYYQIQLEIGSLKEVRGIKDIDFIFFDKNRIYDLIEIFKSFGFDYSKEIMINSEGDRMIFFKKNLDSYTIDVIANPFTLAERIHFRHRFSLSEYTLTITDLFLTKMQRVKLTATDEIDIDAILNAFLVTHDESGINLNRINEVLHDDWAFYKVFTDNLESLKKNLKNHSLAIEMISKEIKNMPKSIRWTLRSLSGTTFSYYNNVEDV